MARGVGRYGLRQLLLGIQQRFPQARLSLFGHSLGCEVIAAAMFPNLPYEEEESAKLPAFEPDKEFYVDLVSLAGSDLDYDIFYESSIPVRVENPRARLVWQTMSPAIGETKDKVLSLRANVRGIAGGSAFPRMTEQQYDTFFGARRFVLDNVDIPPSHDILLYYDENRMGRLTGAMVFLADPKAPKPPELAEMDALSALPDQVSALVPYLDSPLISTQVYAIWRLEKILDGGSQYLANDYLASLARMMRNTPAKVKMARKDSPSVLVREGYWPTRRQMKRAGAPEEL
jgi:hypothetical protein